MTTIILLLCLWDGSDSLSVLIDNPWYLADLSKLKLDWETKVFQKSLENMDAWSRVYNSIYPSSIDLFLSNQEEKWNKE